MKETTEHIVTSSKHSASDPPKSNALSEDTIIGPSFFPLTSEVRKRLTDNHVLHIVAFNLLFALTVRSR